MRPVRACTSTEFSAFRSPEWSLRALLFGNMSSGTVWRPGGSVPGYTTRYVLFWCFVHLAVQSSSTFHFSRSSHCSIDCPTHCSTHCLRAAAWLASTWLRLPLRPALRARSCVWIAAQASLICLARPARSSRAWKRAVLPFNQRSSEGMYASVSSCRIGIALNAPSTSQSPVFWCFAA
jgi:hypothetical protein